MGGSRFLSVKTGFVEKGLGDFNAEPLQMMYAGLFSKLAQVIERIWPQIFFGLSG